MTSFTYMPDNEQPEELLGVDDDDENNENTLLVEDEVELPSPLDEEADIPFDELLPSRSRRSSRLSRSSLRDPLLSSHELMRTSTAGSARGGRTVQKIYIITEDLTIVLAGFSTSPIRAVLYGVLCLATLGMFYLLCRWLPRWRVALLGTPTPLGECSWVVIEVSMHAGRMRRWDSCISSTDEATEPMGRDSCPGCTTAVLWEDAFDGLRRTRGEVPFR